VAAEVGRAKVLLYDELSSKAEKLVSGSGCMDESVCRRWAVGTGAGQAQMHAREKHTWAAAAAIDSAPDHTHACTGPEAACMTKPCASNSCTLNAHTHSCAAHTTACAGGGGDAAVWH
jgi:hypothetical protein